MTQMKPLIFNTEMVRAILDGRKTQTRRIAKNITAVANQTITQSATDDTPSFLFARKGEKILVNKILGQDHWSKGSFKYNCQDIEKKYDGYYTKDEEISINTPYKVGDIIYVRETFIHGVKHDENDRPLTTEDGSDWIWKTYYRADGELLRWVDADGDPINTPWKPSIHMPKEYARLFLRVKDVRIERLNEISEEDAEKEGIRRIGGGEIADTNDYFETQFYYGELEEDDNGYLINDFFDYATDAFENLWESINGKNSFDDRYVWVIKFELISKKEAI